MSSVWGITPKTNVVRGCLAALAAVLTAAAIAAPADAGIPGREADPVVLTGEQTPSLLGVAPEDVVGFSWDGSWKQIPVQVDERKVADLRVVRRWPMSGVQLLTEVYADPFTWTGADGDPQRPTDAPYNGDPIPGTTGDPKFDGNDEIALMSGDSGSSATGHVNPAGVDGATRTVVRIDDPLDAGKQQFVYLFAKTGPLNQSAGRDYVNYDQAFDPPLGSYLFDYRFTAMPGGDDPSYPGAPVANPEKSVVTTDSYASSLPARWMMDELRITTQGSSGADILDGDKATVGPEGCGRNELTFSRGGGGFIANIDGPVRAIRSFIGANSGTYTQRDLIFYRDRFDTNSYLRVHPGITNLVTAMDYSAAAFGMTYRNSANLAGVQIDGQPDSVTPAELDWEQVSGPQGSLTTVSRLDTDMEAVSASSYYLDAETPPANRTAITCSGDTHAYGASGPWISGTGTNTDPTRLAADGYVDRLSAIRSTYVDPWIAGATTAEHHARQVDSPLAVSVGTEPPPVPGGPTGPTGPANPDPSPNPVKPGRKNWVGLAVEVKPANLAAKPGVTKKAKVSVENIGDKLARRIRICPVAKDSLVKTSGCATVKKLKPSRIVRRTFRVRLRSAATAEERVTVRFRAKAKGSKARAAKLTIRPVSG